MSNAFIIRAGNVAKSYVDKNLDLKVDKVEGKGLSTNDYDNEAKMAVDNLGTASKCDIGTSFGNIPVVNSEGKIDSLLIPSLAITDTFTAENQEQMIVLNAQKGDICIRMDESKTYILQNDPAAEISNWVELKSPTDLVQSVNGKVGTVVLNYEDVGAVGDNPEIIGSTKCKITYDSKGLVTSGEDLTSADIPDISSIYETKSNKSDSFTESSSMAYASTKALVDGLSTKSEFKRYTALIPNSWAQGQNGEYTQEVEVAGILETDTPMIDLILSDDIENSKSQIEAWSCVSRITTNTNKIKVYCFENAPTMEFQVQIICIR